MARTSPAATRIPWRLAPWLSALLVCACGARETDPPPSVEPGASSAPVQALDATDAADAGAARRARTGAFAERVEARSRMLERQLRPRGIDDEAVLAAMLAVPRHRFVPERMRDYAYMDSALEIGHEQTISQPYIVAQMTQAARVRPDSRVLEVGTGSGYQAAVLAELTPHVWSVEILEPLGRRARATLDALGYADVVTRIGDGYAGWPEQAPFDVILVTAAPDHVPQPLIEQLAVGGRLVIPVGARWPGQQLLVLHKLADGSLRREELGAVRFVPMTGEAEDERPR